MNVDIIRTYKTRGKYNRFITVYIATGQSWAEDRHGNELCRIDNNLTFEATDLDIGKELGNIRKMLKGQATLLAYSSSDSPAYQEAREARGLNVGESKLFPHWSTKNEEELLIEEVGVRTKSGDELTVFVKAGVTWAEDDKGELILSEPNELTVPSAIVSVLDHLQSFTRRNELFDIRKEPELSTSTVTTMSKTSTQPITTTLTRKIHASTIDNGHVLNKRELSHINVIIEFVLKMIGGDGLIETSKSGGLMVIVDLDSLSTDENTSGQYIKGMAFVTLSNGNAWVIDKPPLTHLPWTTRQTQDDMKSQIHTFLTSWIKANGTIPPGDTFGYLETP